MLVFTNSAIILGSAEIRLRSFSIQEVNMYAVIKTGGKQYRVASGEKIKVEQIAADVGQEIVIDQVLAVGTAAGSRLAHPWCPAQL
jgi:large subunit ribosomal protein L21